jgi:hypothetical protein
VPARGWTLLFTPRQHEANFAKWAQEQGFGSGDLSHLASDSKVKSAVLAQINATGKAAGLAPMEALGAIVLTFDEWTPESGMVTAAQKSASGPDPVRRLGSDQSSPSPPTVQRKNIEKKYEAEIKVRPGARTGSTL